MCPVFLSYLPQIVNLELAIMLGSEYMRRPPGFRAGLALETEISHELSRMRIPHELTRGREENIQQRVDLRITPPPHAQHEPTFEMQLTLRRGNNRKMTDFAVAALNSTDRGIRVYVEVIASRNKSIARIASRVAWAIKDIVRRFRDFGPNRLFGVRVRVGRSRRNPKMERFSLMDLVGARVMHTLAVEKSRRRTQFAALLKQARAAKQALFPQRTPPRINRRIPSTAPSRWSTQHRGFVPIRQPR